MKKLAIFLAVLLLLAVPVLAAEPTEALRDVIGTDELTQSLPDEAAEVLDGLSPDGMPDFRSGVRSILRAAAFACARCCWPWLRCAPSCA